MTTHFAIARGRRGKGLGGRQARERKHQLGQVRRTLKQYRQTDRTIDLAP